MELLGEDTEWGADPFSDSLAMQAEAAECGFDWENVLDVVDKLREEIEELDVAIRRDDRSGTSHEIGDLFLALINVARKAELSPHVVMREANDRFRGRFVKMRSLIESQGRRLDDCSVEELNKYWNAVKRVDHSN